MGKAGKVAGIKGCTTVAMGFLLGWGIVACGGGTEGTTVAPAPSFSLTLATPVPLAMIAGGAPQTVNVTATAINGFSGNVTVAISGLPTGVTAHPASLTLTRGKAKNITLKAGATSAPGISTVTFIGLSSTLSRVATLELTLTMPVDMTTYHYDNARDGLNAAETILTATNVNSTQFGKIGFDTVDGVVDASPLYVANVRINGTFHNVLYIATET